MSDKNKKNNKNNVQNTDNNLQNLASILLNNQNSSDLGSMVRLVASLLQNDSIMNSVTELAKNKQSEPEIPTNEEITEPASLSDQMEKMAHNFSELKTELLNLKEQNIYLTKLIKKLYKK